MTELTPTEICCRDLIAAADGMGVRRLSGAVAPETEARLRELLSASAIEARQRLDPEEGLDPKGESAVAKPDAQTPSGDHP